MTYNPNIPNPTDLLSNSQGQIKTNFSSANTSFGIDHYAFDNATPNNGFHNKVTTPLIVGSAHPTTTTNPIFYAMQDTANIGVIQYSRGPVFNGYVPSPTPVTNLQSPNTAISLLNNATTNVLDFTGITTAIGILYVLNAADNSPTGVLNGVAQFTYHLVSTGAVPTFDIRYSGTSNLQVNNSGSILRIRNVAGGTLNNIYWSLSFQRIII